MTRPDIPEIPLAADETTMLSAFLNFYRAALLDRVFGLSTAQMNTPLPPSSLTLARLLSHMTFVEYCWFQERLDGEPLPQPFDDLDWDRDPDAEMVAFGAASPDDLVTSLNESIADSNTRTAKADSLDQLSKATNAAGEHWSLRWILIHMIEEYARHCGHADLIRESIDGDTVN